jgi:transcriptional regulator with XRE-family HTH domain
MTLKSYYSELEDPRKHIRDKIMSECGVTRETVYNWINGKSIPGKLQQDKIATIVNMPVDELFTSKSSEE